MLIFSHEEGERKPLNSRQTKKLAPNHRALGPKYDNIDGMWVLNLYYLGPEIHPESATADSEWQSPEHSPAGAQAGLAARPSAGVATAYWWLVGKKGI